ncbi:hypothetical protein AX16_004358 [Volvariella volvacea WC 439]|nr:hypothetical protein AX16_004358 [Volvariella volvacea WC 439]
MLEEDTSELEGVAAQGDLVALVKLYERLTKDYQSHPYFTTRLAGLFSEMDAKPLALIYYREANQVLHEMGDEDSVLQSILLQFSIEMQDVVNANASVWRADILTQWSEFKSKSSLAYGSYLQKFAIETNHLESIFLLTDGSTEDLVRRGIVEGVVDYQAESLIKDPAKIKSIINDTMASYEIVRNIVNHRTPLNQELLCLIHAKLMYTCRFSEVDSNPPIRCIASGKTRTATRDTVVIGVTQRIQCCAHEEVDKELDYIFRVTNDRIAEPNLNPFAAASWIHTVLVRCHPFEDGNGRITRLISSIPLIMQGYPPISISLSQRRSYYDSLNAAYYGNYSMLIDCIMVGMKETIESVKQTLSSSSSH